jgi:hypothetical protein
MSQTSDKKPCKLLILHIYNINYRSQKPMASSRAGSIPAFGTKQNNLLKSLRF